MMDTGFNWLYFIGFWGAIFAAWLLGRNVRPARESDEYNGLWSDDYSRD